MGSPTNSGRSCISMYKPRNPKAMTIQLRSPAQINAPRHEAGPDAISRSGAAETVGAAMESELYIAVSLKLHGILQHRQPMFCARRRRRAHSALFAFREAVVPGTRRRRPGEASGGWFPGELSSAR